MGQGSTKIFFKQSQLNDLHAIKQKNPIKFNEHYQPLIAGLSDRKKIV